MRTHLTHKAFGLFRNIQRSNCAVNEGLKCNPEAGAWISVLGVAFWKSQVSALSYQENDKEIHL